MTKVRTALPGQKLRECSMWNICGKLHCSKQFYEKFGSTCARVSAQNRALNPGHAQGSILTHGYSASPPPTSS